MTTIDFLKKSLQTTRFSGIQACLLAGKIKQLHVVLQRPLYRRPVQ